MRAWHYGLVFVIFDIFAFIVQIAGAAQAAGNDVPEDKVMRGLHIYMGGVGIQQLFILGFCVAVFVFWRDFRRQEAKSTPPHVLGLVYTLVAVLILVTVSSNKDDVRGSCLMCLDSNHFPSDRVCQRIREQYSGA